MYLIATHKTTKRSYLVRPAPDYPHPEIFDGNKWVKAGWFSNDYIVLIKITNIKFKER